MKFKNRYTVALCAAALAVSAPGWTQDVTVNISDLDDLIAAMPDVRVDVKVVQVPEVRVETQVETSPEVRIVQQRSKAAQATELAVQAQALQQYTAGQVYQNLTSLYNPEMGKKTREITLLRQMLNLNLTARDIERALPLLKEMKDSDKIAPVKPEQALDDEYNALLRAKPGDPMPPSSSSALRGAAGSYRSRRQAIWDKMAQQIGREKASGIRAMVRSESFPAGSSWQGLFTVPKISGSTSGQPFLYRYEEKSKTKPAREKDAAPAAVDPPAVLKSDDDEAPVARPTRPRTTRPDVAPPDDTTAEAPAARQAERDARRATARAQRSVPAVPAQPPTTVYVTPNARALTLDGNGRTVLHVGYLGQVSIDELIDLFERKLSAMRR